MLTALLKPMLIETATKKTPGITTTTSILATHSGLHKVTVIHRFDSGNFIKNEHDNLSLVAAQGLLKFFTM